MRGTDTTLFPISSANPSASFSEVSPEDSLGACHRTRLAKRKSSLGIKVSPPSFSAYLIVTVYMRHNSRSCGYGLKENPLGRDQEPAPSGESVRDSELTSAHTHYQGEGHGLKHNIGQREDLLVQVPHIDAYLLCAYVLLGASKILSMTGPESCLQGTHGVGGWAAEATPERKAA